MAPTMVAAQAQPASPDQVIELRQAQRISSEGNDAVTLPDTLELAPGAKAPVRALYRMKVPVDTVPRRLSIWMPGLIAHARVRFNGHVVFDSLGNALDPLPRGVDRIRLIDVPEEFVRSGDNSIEIEAAGPATISVSRVIVGPRGTLEPQFERRVFGVIVGPAIVAVVVGSLSLCVLLLWVRRGDSLYGYFGLGSLCWALHTAWSVLPWSPLTGVHRAVWWTSLYTLFVAMLVIFCVRFAGWRWPRFDRTLSVAALSAPLLLYLAEHAGVLDTAQEFWLLAWIGVVAVGLAAVGRYAWTHRNADGALLLLTGAVSFVFALRDWLVNHAGDDNYPVYLVPYAGLLFVMLVAWMLIDRFVVASRELETMNLELEQRVDTKSTELVHALEQMRAAKENAEAANRSKSTFLAAASHDLRQPIHALGLYMAALVDDRISAGQQDLVQRMKASLTALESMFNALLDVSRMDAGAVIPRQRAFALEPMLHRLAQECAPLAEEKNLRLSLRVSPAIRHLQARSDPMLVECIVLNLLGNAVKYTHTGGVLLSCRLRGGRQGHWRVEVWDTGPGIAAADRARVFDEFYQVGNPERNRAAGLGLGLSIVRRLCDLLGHRLELRSQPGRGTCFALDLPCTDEALAIVTPEGQIGTLEHLAVAVVEDDMEVRESTQLLLQRWGCRVYAGADAAEVLRCAGAAEDLQAIVADYRLREWRTGVEAIHALRLACGRNVPALIVSGDSSPQQLTLMQASGFDYLSKPVAPARLRTWLAAVARRGEGVARPAAAEVVKANGECE